MGRKHFTPGVAAALALALITSSPAAMTEIVSLAPDGDPADAGSTFSAVSADGRFVAFTSGATNLVARDTNGAFDVFVRDRVAGTTERVSVDSAGGQATAMSVAPAISGDGRVIAFVSAASNLVVGDTNGRLDVFVHDRTTGSTSRVSVDSGGAEASADSLAPWLSHDGSRVVFASSAPDLVAGDANATFDVFVHDRPTGVTARVSVDSAGNEADGLSLAPRISADGLVVVFHSLATNLVAGDLNPGFDVFVHDLSTGATEMVSVDSAGAPGNFPSVAGSLSADGRFVAFDSDATNLVADDLNFRTDVFVHDRQTGTTERVSVSTDGTGGNGQSGFVDPPAISADGRVVAFASGASNLVAADGNNFVDMFVRDRASGSTSRVSVARDGTEGDAPVAHWPNLSANGNVVVFASLATNLVVGDTNAAQDVFAQASSCGNSTVDPGEECDDGNLDDGDCCTTACTLAPPGSLCDDGDLCTRGDFCSAGQCVSGPLDAASCLDPMRCYKAHPADGIPPMRPGRKLVANSLQQGTAKIRSARRLCSAVDLEGIDSMPMNGPRLACHHVRGRDGLRSMGGEEITVSNEFGVQTLAVYRPRRVCLAAGWTEPPTPGTLDHFTCYSADSADGAGSVGLAGIHNDAYGRFESKIAQAVELCTASSIEGGGIAHPRAHLVCYRARDLRHRTSADVFEPREETVHHEFGTETLELIRLRRVCVPSEILDRTPPHRWARLNEARPRRSSRSPRPVRPGEASRDRYGPRIALRAASPRRCRSREQGRESTRPGRPR